MDAELLKMRVDGIQQSLRRTRFALLAAVVVSATVLIAIWNEYFTWDSILFEPKPANPSTQPKGPEPAPGTAEESREQQRDDEWIKNFVDNWTISISLLGIRVSGSDLSVLGSLALVFFSLYWCICARRANHEVGSLLSELKDAEQPQRRLAFAGIRSDLVFTTTKEDDRPFSDLAHSDRREVHDRALRSGLYFLPFLPSVAAVLVLLSDLYYYLFYQVGGVRRWDQVPYAYKYRLASTDAIGVLLLVLIVSYNWSTHRYLRGTARVSDEFRAKYASDFASSI